MKNLLLLSIIFLLLFCSSCAPHYVDVAPMEIDRPGFLMGLWHGFITPFTFLISLFNDYISIYAAYNSGGWYDLGFIFGAYSSFGGTAFGAKKAKRRS